MRYFISALVVFFVSCGAEPIRPTNPLNPEPEHEKILRYDEAFSKYIQEFESDWGLNIEDLTARFNTIDQDDTKAIVILGTCTTRANTTPHITIDTNLWANLTDTRRKLLMYHELGHCVLFRKHVEGYGTSIMNPMLIGSAIFSSKENFFINELFNENTHGSLHKEDNDG